jgi:hypothetical protein
MTNFAKPLTRLTRKELEEIANNASPQYGSLALYELHRRQQEKNNSQIFDLIKETKALKDITETNSIISKRNEQSSKKIAISAFVVGVVSLLIAALQLRVEIGLPSECYHTWGPNGEALTERCAYHLKFGAYEFNWEEAVFRELKQPR